MYGILKNHEYSDDARMEGPWVYCFEWEEDARFAFEVMNAMWYPTDEKVKEISRLPWRVGTKVGRNIYDSRNHWIGVAETDYKAGKIVKRVNLFKSHWAEIPL